jgi:hypothetical protein
MQPGDVVSHAEMCLREGLSLQRGMNFHVADSHSVVLMSVRIGAPYDDEILDGGRTLIYEGHDVPKIGNVRDPKKYDQPEFTPSGKLTQNGYFAKAARDFKAGNRAPELVRVYQKIRSGIWEYSGDFQLVDVFMATVDTRRVFKFRLEMVSQLAVAADAPRSPRADVPHNRMIPSRIKQEVYKRDKGCCVMCGSKDNLHFDHDFPFSKGGTSISAANIRLLCMRHNLQKRDKVE